MAFTDKPTSAEDLRVTWKERLDTALLIAPILTLLVMVLIVRHQHDAKKALQIQKCAAIEHVIRSG